MLPIDEPVWLAIFLPLRSSILVMPRSLRDHHRRGLADGFDHRDGDEAALVVADDERLAGVGAEVDLARHHLLHGEVAGRHGEFLELDAALLEQSRTSSGNRSACPRCWSGSPGERSCSPARPHRGSILRPAPARSRRPRPDGGGGCNRLAELSSLSSVECFCCVDWMLCGGAGQGRAARAGCGKCGHRQSCCMPNSRMVDATSSSVCVDDLPSSAGVEDAGIEPPSR